MCEGWVLEFQEVYVLDYDDSIKCQEPDTVSFNGVGCMRVAKVCPMEGSWV